MELVDSVLAFALIMAALASVVTLLMEAFHRALRLRARSMEALFDQFYDEVLSRKLNIPEVNDQGMANKGLIVHSVLINPARKIILSSSNKIFPNTVIKWITRSTEVSTDELFKRLGQTDALKDLKGTTNKEAREILESIEDQYAEYSAAMSDYFKRRAKLFSLLMGIFLAFSANIDGLRMFEALQINPRIRAGIISQQASLEDSYKSAQRNLKNIALSTKLQTKDEQKQIESLNKNIERATNEISRLASMGLPIGWRYFPANTDKNGGEQGKNSPASYVIWFFKVLIIGLLIGLGAPFWFDVAQKVTRLKRGLKGNGSKAERALPESTIPVVKTSIDKLVERI